MTKVFLFCKLQPDTNEASIDDVCTDDENDEVEYEAWKLRELKRLKRDRDEKEQYVLLLTVYFRSLLC